MQVGVRLALVCGAAEIGQQPETLPALGKSDFDARRATAPMLGPRHICCWVRWPSGTDQEHDTFPPQPVDETRCAAAVLARRPTGVISRAWMSGCGGDTHRAGACPATIRQNVQSKSGAPAVGISRCASWSGALLVDGLLRPAEPVVGRGNQSFGHDQAVSQPGRNRFRVPRPESGAVLRPAIGSLEEHSARDHRRQRSVVAVHD